MDISVTLKSDTIMILNSLKQNMEVEPSMQDKFTYEETDNSVTFNFEDIDPTKDNLFKENDETDTSILDKESYNFKKEFKFPYYYYTYEINATNEDEETEENEISLFNETEMNAMFGIGYTIEVFGKIVETNGNKMSNNKVKFNMGMNDDKVYYVKFRDFFITNWIGSLS